VARLPISAKHGSENRRSRNCSPPLGADQALVCPRDSYACREDDRKRKFFLWWFSHRTVAL
jgi:hypothetical protein